MKKVTVRCEKCGRVWKQLPNETPKCYECNTGKWISIMPAGTEQNRPDPMTAQRMHRMYEQVEARAEAYHRARALRHGGDKLEVRQRKALEMRREREWPK